MNYQDIPKRTEAGLERWATAQELCDAIGIKDRRCLNKWRIRRMRFSPRCVRYHVGDFIAKVDARTTHKKESQRRRDKRTGRFRDRPKVTSAKASRLKRYALESASFNYSETALLSGDL